MKVTSVRISLVVFLVSIFAIAGMASAVSIDFADYQAAENGTDSVNISAGDIDMWVTAGPSGSRLTIGAGGLGVDCIGGYFRCFLDDPDEIDALLGETIRIDFSQSVYLDSITFSNLTSVWGLNDSGEVEAGGFTVSFDGADWLVNGSQETVDFGGLLTSYIEVTGTGYGIETYVSDFSIQSLVASTTSLSGAGVTPSDPVSGVPEPTAAVLFLAGCILVRRGIRSRE